METESDYVAEEIPADIPSTADWSTIPLAEISPDEDNVIFHGEHPALAAALNYIVPDIEDYRLYVPWPERINVKLKTDVSNEFCFQQFNGQDYYHHLLTGELYVQFNDSKYCLTCALQKGLVTNNRLFWQRTTTSPEPSFEDISQDKLTC